MRILARQRGAFQALSFGAAYKVLERDNAPFGLTVVVEPNWGRVDDTSGANRYGAELSIAADKELIANRIFGAFNLLYQPDATRLRFTGAWQHQSDFGISSALSAQVRPGVFFGAEARYVRSYDGLGLNIFTGQAVFVGPTLYARISEHVWISAAWSASGRTGRR